MPTYETIVKEDLNTGFGTVSITNPAGGTLTGNQIGIHSFLGEHYNVMDHGALGDDAADDTVAIQAAIDQVPAAGGSVFLPEGVYRISAQLDLDAKNGIRLYGEGRGSIIKPTAAITCLAPNLTVATNYASLLIEDIAFDLNDTNSTCIATTNAGQHGVIQRIYVDNNLATATATLFTTDNASHSLVFRDIRVRGQSNDAHCFDIDSNIVVIENCDVTGCEAAVYVDSDNAISQLVVQDSRLDDNVHAVQIDTAAMLSLSICRNRFEDNTGVTLALRGFDSTTNRIFNCSVIGNYFAGLDTAAQDGVLVRNMQGFVLAANHFAGPALPAAAVAEALVIETASVTNVSIYNNTVNQVLATITGQTGPPLELSDITVPQFSQSLTCNSLVTNSITGGVTVGSNLVGTATFVSAATVAVAFGTNEPDSSYEVLVAPTLNETFWVTAKATTGFTINSSNATSTAVVGWVLIRRS